MDKMGMEVNHVGPGLGGQHQGLAEPPDPVGGAVAGQILEPNPPGGAIARHAPAGAPAAPQPQRFTPEIFGKIDDGRLDLIVYGVNMWVRRAPERDDIYGQAARFEGLDFLGDERFGKPRIALQDECNRAPHVAFALTGLARTVDIGVARLHGETRFHHPIDVDETVEEPGYDDLRRRRLARQIA